MQLEEVRQFCLSLPHTTEDLKWGNDAVFSIGGKMYAVVDVSSFQPHTLSVVDRLPKRVSFKCTPQAYAELIEKPGIIPAPYMARHYWIALECPQMMRTDELRNYLRRSYAMARDNLPKKVLEQFV